MGAIVLNNALSEWRGGSSSIADIVWMQQYHPCRQRDIKMCWKKNTVIKHSSGVKYADSVSLKCLLCKMSLERSAITNRSTVPSVSISGWREIEESSSLKTQSSIFPSVYLYLILSIPASFWFSLSFSLRCQAPLRPETVMWIWGLRAKRASQGNYLELAGHLMRFTMIYVALCTENRIREPHIGLLLINSTL